MEPVERERNGNPLRLVGGLVLGVLLAGLLVGPFLASGWGPLAYKAPPELALKPAKQSPPSRRPAAEGADLEALKKGVDLEALGKRLSADVKALVSTGTDGAPTGRMAGSPGAARAAELIRQRFEQAGLKNVQFQDFPVTVPVTLESSLVAGGQSYPVSPFWPNAARTCTLDGEVQAPLVYGGDGRLENLSGQEVAKSILVLDNDRGLDWVTACSLGARAVIFLEPAAGLETAGGKVLVAAVDLPRFWLPRAEGLKLVAAIEKARAGGAPLAATLKCRVDWLNRTARNVYGLLPGKNPNKQRDVAMVAVAYDSPSLVPDLAPGAEPAANVAAMFELIERLKVRPPERPVLFLAVGAHYQAMLGEQHAAELFRRPAGDLLTELEALDGPALGVDSRRVLSASGAMVSGLIPWQRVLLIVLGVVLLAVAVLVIVYLRTGRAKRWAIAVGVVLIGAIAISETGSRLSKERQASPGEIARLQAEPAWKSCSYAELRTEIGKLEPTKLELAKGLLAVIERREGAERDAILARGDLRKYLREEEGRRKDLAAQGITGHAPLPADWLKGFAESAAKLDLAAHKAADFQPAGEDRVGSPLPTLVDYGRMRDLLVAAQKEDRGSRPVDRCLTALANLEERQKNGTPGRLKYLRYCRYLSFLGRLGPDLPERVKSCVWLDISSHATSMATFYKGQYVAEVIKRDEKILQNAVNPLAEYLARTGSAQAAQAAALGWSGGEEAPFVADSSASQSEQTIIAYPGCPYYGAEIFLLAGLPSLTLGSTADGRRRLNTPLDLPEHMDFAGLARQAEVAAHALGEALGAGPSGSRGLAAIEKMESQSELRNYKTFLRISGLVTEYNPAKSRTLSVIPVPGALVFSRRESVGNRSVRPTYAPVRAFAATLADKWGGYEFFGLPAAEVREWNDGEHRMLASLIEAPSGRIVQTLDEGEQGQKRGKPWRIPRRTEDEFFLGTFQCAALNIFEISDLRSFEAMDTQFSTATMYFGQADAVPISYGLSMAGETPNEACPEHALVLFVQKTTGQTDDLKAPRVKSIFGRRRLAGVRWPMLSVPGDGWETQAGQGQVDRSKQAKTYQGIGQRVGAEGASRILDQDTGRRIPASLLMAQDLWRLDDYRLYLLDKAGVKNASLVQQHESAGRALADAREAAEGKLWPRMLASARAAWQFEARAYPNIQATVTDVVKGLLFYLFLMLPFAYFVERLIFAFPDINRQLAGVFGVFMAAFALLFVMHPAFRITSSAPMILLAFITIALAVLVIGMISSRFKRELEVLQHRPGRGHKADMDRFNAALSAFLLGINNMRRRKVRTILTLVTLVLLTFSVLSFSSIESTLGANRRLIAQDREQPYQGLLIRNETWMNLDEFAYRSLRNEFGASGQCVVAPRAWLAGQGVLVGLSVAGSPEKSLNVRGLLGVIPQESGVTGLGAEEVSREGRRERLLEAGRWFRPEEESAPVCVLPQKLAEDLKLNLADIRENAELKDLPTVIIAGMPLAVVGVLADEPFRTLTDIDGESPVPVDYEVESWQRGYGRASGADAVEFRKYTHQDPRTVPVVPYDWLMGRGGRLFSVAIKPADPKAVKGLAEDQLLRRVSVPMFLSSAMDERGQAGAPRVTFVSTANSSDVSGVGSLLVPMLIAALIVLNTMLGAVYEREKEISIFGALGLAPVHIGSLFIAESAVFAVVSAVLGYVLGQSVAKLVVTFPELSAGLLGGISLNYSSLSAVFSACFIIAVVMLSAAYPAFRAGRLSVPDVERVWKFPQPQGDRLVFDFPFTVSGDQALGVNMHLVNFFRDHANQSVGDFYTADTRFTPRDPQNRGSGGYRLSSRVWIAPFDFGISQLLELETFLAAGETNIYETRMILTRISGSPEAWVKVNHRFMKGIRKQFLLWRLFSPEEREWHVTQARALLGDAPPPDNQARPAIAAPDAG